ncbi:TPA: phage antirepressor KilAC domain-containing protein [Escherichia coli]
MSELMVFDVDSEVLMISSREIAEATGKDHSSVVVRDIKNMLLDLGFTEHDFYPAKMQDFEFIGFLFKYKQYKGRNVIDEVLLNKELTMCLITGYDVKQRMKVIKRVKELEEAQHKLALPDFTDPVVAARAWADEVEQKLLAQKEVDRLVLENKELAPKAAVYNAIAKNEQHRNATQVAKPLGMTAAQLNKKLEQVDVYDTRIKRGGRMFKQWFLDKGYGVVKCSPEGYVQSLFTAKGQLWVSELFACK